VCGLRPLLWADHRPPLYRLQTPPAEVARAVLVVLRRGRLLAAEDVTGHKYETIGRWLRRAAAHAAVLTDALVHDLHLTEGEVDECWSFVRHKGGQPKRPAPAAPGRPPRTGPVEPLVNAGGA
jgi:hypothetical protein